MILPSLSRVLYDTSGAVATAIKAVTSLIVFIRISKLFKTRFVKRLLIERRHDRRIFLY